ncbi:MAG: nitrite/sulfite reductase [Lachnospiraceae bacterium]|nr:nitrite/sulfite reductase [Lachnospiraceae bacterium]
MAQDHVAEFRGDLKEFHEMTGKFYRQEIGVPEYKSFSGGFGSYAQRGAQRSMLRLRLTGGEIDQDQMKFIADSVRKYGIGRVHLTTCQSVQLHDLTEKTVCGLIEEAFEHGIITRGGGGDFPRNVMCSPLSGVEEGECFDVMPYVREAADYALGLIKKVKLPRKLKICFENGVTNDTHATFRDLGFIAAPDGTFTVYAAGGLGNNPKLGVKLAEGAAPSQILYYIKSMVDVFTEYGEYKNRARSRTRYLQDTLGADGIRKAFAEKLEANLAAGGMDVAPEASVCAKAGDGEICDRRVIKQKQPGLYAVAYHPYGGNVAPDFFEKLYETVGGMEGVKARLTPEEGMYLINLTAKEAEKVLAVTADGAQTLFEQSVACIGASTCQVGIGRSQELLAACIERVKKENFADGVLPKIHISGCPSSCSAHQIGAIGMRGGKKPTADGPKFSFMVYENGSEAFGEERFGTDLANMLEEDIPEFLAVLGREIADKGMTYEQFRRECPERLREIAQRFA